VRHLLKLALPSESAWQTMRAAHFSGPGVEVVILGTLYRETGAMVTVAGPGGTMQVPERVATNALYHVDLIAPEVPAEVRQYLVNPAVTKHVWYGNHTLAMPEELVESEETHMISRGIGAVVPDDILARLDRAVLRGRITPEMAEDRKAWIEAGILITEMRELIEKTRTDRENAIKEVREARDERDRLLALKEQETAKRQAAITAIVNLSGKARQDKIAERDAATLKATEYTEAAALEATKFQKAIEKRDTASATFDALLLEIQSARNTRAILKQNLKD
jgi:hypothetical protein